MNQIAQSKPPLLFIAPYFYPRHYGGAVQVFDQLMSRIDAFDVTVLAERQGADPDPLEAFDREAREGRGYRVRRMDRLGLHFRGRRRLINLLDAARFYFTTGREFDACVRSVAPWVVVNGGHYRTGWLMHRLPPGVVRVNYVLGEELTQQLDYGPIARRLRREQIRATHEADLNLVISRFTQQRLQELTGVPDENIRLFPCFIDTERFRPPEDREAVRNQQGWAGRTVLLTIARLIPRKGIDQVLRALAASRTLPPDWLYAIGGRGPEAEALKKLAGDLGISDRVQWLEFVPDKDVPDLYGASDLFIQTNRAVQGDTEGFGVVFLEANACGTAVIGGMAGGTADAIDDGVSGLLVDGDHVEAVGEAIESLLNHPDARREMARRGLDRVRESFGVERRAREFEEILQEIMEPGATKPRSE